MGIFDTNQNPFIQSQQSLAPIQTGTLFDPLIALGAQLRSRQNDQLIAEQKRKAAADAIARQDLLAQQKFDQERKLAVLNSGLSVAKQAQKDAAALKVAEAKAKKALAGATRKVDLLIKQGRVDPANRQAQIDAIAAGQTGTIKPSGKGQKIEVNVDTFDKAATNKIEKDLIQSFALSEQLKSIDKTAKSLPDKFWTIQGRLGSSIENFVSKVGIPSDPSERAGRDTFIRLVRDSGALFDNYRKAITGTQASVQELEILKTRMPVADGLINFDSKGDFFAKARSLGAFASATQDRLKRLRKDGVTIIKSDLGLVGRRKDGSLVNVAIEYPLDFDKIFSIGVSSPKESVGATTQIQQPDSNGVLPESAISSLQEGFVTTFANGQGWTIKNGVPERVK